MSDKRGKIQDARYYVYPAHVSSILPLAFHRSEATPHWNLKPCIPLYRCGLLSSVLRIIRISGNNKNAPFNVFLQFHLSFSKIRPPHTPHCKELKNGSLASPCRRAQRGGNAAVNQRGPQTCSKIKPGLFPRLG